MKKIGRAKASLELNLAIAIKDNKKCLYKYISDKKGGLRRISTPKSELLW